MIGETNYLWKRGIVGNDSQLSSTQSQYACLRCATHVLTHYIVRAIPKASVVRCFSASPYANVMVCP